MSDNQLIRVLVLIDGFNLYHSIVDLCKAHQATKNLNYLKWLNLYSLSNAFIPKSKQTIVGVKYFTAYANWLKNGQPQRHKLYVEALKSVDVEAIFGSFKTKKKACKNCSTTWDSHEEKASDVNIAIHLVSEAYKDTFDRAIILTADTDIVPAISIVKNIFPNKIIDVAIPKHRKINKTELKNACDNMIEIKLSHFERNLFPERIDLGNGKIINAPAEYIKPR